MPGLDEIVKRFATIGRIIFGNRDRLPELDISPRGFKVSFLAIVIAIIPSFAGGAVAVFNGQMIMMQVFQQMFVLLSVWIVPVMLVIALSGWLGIRDRILPFVITYNWGLAFAQWFSALVMVLMFVLPSVLLPQMAGLLIVFSIFVFYRIFRVSLDKPVFYSVVFFILYFVTSAIIMLVASDVAGLPLPGIEL